MKKPTNENINKKIIQKEGNLPIVQLENVQKEINQQIPKKRKKKRKSQGICHELRALLPEETWQTLTEFQATKALMEFVDEQRKRDKNFLKTFAQTGNFNYRSVITTVCRFNATVNRERKDKNLLATSQDVTISKENLPNTSEDITTSKEKQKTFELDSTLDHEISLIKEHFSGRSHREIKQIFYLEENKILYTEEYNFNPEALEVFLADVDDKINQLPWKEHMALKKTLEKTFNEPFPTPQKKIKSNDGGFFYSKNTGGKDTSDIVTEENHSLLFK